MAHADDVMARADVEALLLKVPVCVCHAESWGVVSVAGPRAEHCG
jgi:hypothetical protein